MAENEQENGREPLTKREREVITGTGGSPELPLPHRSGLAWRVKLKEIVPGNYSAEQKRPLE